VTGHHIPAASAPRYGVFCIWAEEGADLSSGVFEWSFGNGNESPSGVGVFVPFDCELFAVGLVIEGTGPAEVEVRQNGTSAGRSVVIASGDRAFTDFAQSPVAFATGDVVGFRTVTGGVDTNGGTVTAWFRYPI